jgi:hypothetical protein
MNTIIETTTEATSATPKSFTDIRSKWKARAAIRNTTSADIAALCIYRSMIRGECKQATIARLRRSFTPVSNPIKLQNGHSRWHGLASGLFAVKFSPLLEWMTKEESVELLGIAKSINAYGEEIK